LDFDACGVRAPAEIAAGLLSANPIALQIRGKDRSARELFDVARAVMPLTTAARCPLIVNDRLDVALAAGADGVHLGQDDLPLALARKLAPPGFSIGVSTHSLAEALDAEQGGASLIGFGPVFATATKANPSPVQGIAALAAVVRAVSIPVVAIGGITAANIHEVARTGCAAATSIAAVLLAEDRAAAAATIAAAFFQ
jgi:thiamine-phosphate pyrophosphorylase